MSPEPLEEANEGVGGGSTFASEGEIVGRVSEMLRREMAPGAGETALLEVVVEGDIGMLGHADIYLRRSVGR